jgi:hypothetical protein
MSQENVEPIALGGASGDGSRLGMPKPRLAGPNVPRMYRRVGGFWLSNRHRSLDSLGGPTPRLEGGPR